MFLFFWGFLEYYTRPIIKWFLRQLTGKCELLRITDNKPRGASRTVLIGLYPLISFTFISIEKSIGASKSAEIRSGLQWSKDFSYDDYITYVVTVKCISEFEYPQYVSCASIRLSLLSFRQALHYCLQQIHAYAKLMDDVNQIKSTAYRSDDPYHEEMMSKVCLSFFLQVFIIVVETVAP